MKTRIRGLYAITPDTDDERILEVKLSKAFQGGVRLLQYRRKTQANVVQTQEARLYRQLAHAAGATFIVNDNLALAQAIHADGVHWGQDDVPLESLAERIHIAKKEAIQGDHFIVGISCYNNFARAQAAVAAGADYVAFGSLFASKTKPDAAIANLDLIRKAKAAFDIPIVAIGGITRDNAASVVEAGADALAVITAIFSTLSGAEIDDTSARVKTFSPFFEND
ncbi:MAG: thiamine phosphate synthase [Pseudomonadota bacterium]